jgi:hypothetical protein
MRVLGIGDSMDLGSMYLDLLRAATMSIARLVTRTAKVMAVAPECHRWFVIVCLP